jgi:hypothetical protein
VDSIEAMLEMHFYSPFFKGDIQIVENISLIIFKRNNWGIWLQNNTAY